MKYTIIIPPQSDLKVRKLLARTIAARHPGFSFSELIDILQYEEFKYARNVSEAELIPIKQQLDDLSIQYWVDSIEEKTVAKTPVKEETPDNSTLAELPREQVHITAKEKISTLKPAPPAQKTRPVASVIVTLVFLLGFFLTAVILTNQSKKRNFSIPGNTTKNSSASKLKRPQNQSFDPSATPQEKASREYIDSADLTCIENGSDAESLYRFAISFNKYNKDAWFGLLNCYRSIGKTQEANQVEIEMKQLFGESVLNPKEFHRAYGTTEAIEIKGNTVSLVYQTQREKNTLLYSDLFQIVRRYASLDQFSTITILAKKENGSGIFATIPLNDCITYSSFISSGNFQEF